MKVTETCAACLLDKQQHLTADQNYLKEIQEIIQNRNENDSAPYLVYLFNQVYERHFGKQASYREVRKTYNHFVLSMEDAIREKIEASSDPLATSLAYARIGNYIDFGAMNHIDENTFLTLLDDACLQERDQQAFRSFKSQCEKAERFLLVADNCGEIVLDKLFLQQLKKAFSHLKISVMVRGTMQRLKTPFTFISEMLQKSFPMGPLLQEQSMKCFRMRQKKLWIRQTSFLQKGRGTMNQFAGRAGMFSILSSASAICLQTDSGFPALLGFFWRRWNNKAMAFVERR